MTIIIHGENLKEIEISLMLSICLIESGQTRPLSTHHTFHELCAKNFKKWASVISKLEIIKGIITVSVTYVEW